ncbi:peptide synthetase [Sclerotinia borealis F-4128]|uniref:Peptide synthetase n=1 Tax=Sclerotinia borealis (strain F-4128) TaxID=1432307 RepID=W9CHK0_SCLBF|nr:peptide synthetase [Sclerotinia borealis F-4128]
MSKPYNPNTCFFPNRPTLSQHPGAENLVPKYESMNVSLPHRPVEELSDAILAAWPLILRYYVGQNSVFYRRSTSKFAGQASGNNVRFCFVELKNDSYIKDIERMSRFKFEKGRWLVYNTEVATMSNQDQLKKMCEDFDPQIVLKLVIMPDSRLCLLWDSKEITRMRARLIAEDIEVFLSEYDTTMTVQELKLHNRYMPVKYWVSPKSVTAKASVLVRCLRSDNEQLQLQFSIQDCSNIKTIELGDWIISSEPEAELDVPIGLKHLAYLIFTSDKTGQLKGVMVSHHAMAMRATLHQLQGGGLGLSDSSRVLQASPYESDVCLLEIFATLVYGGCVCVPSEEEFVNDLPDIIRRLSVNYLPLTLPAARLVLPSEVPGVKSVLFSVSSDTSLFDVIREWTGKVELFQIYGTSECSVACAASNGLHDGKIDIEDDIARLWIVHKDDYNILVPPNTFGELLVEGPLLAMEYYKDEDKTAEAFIDIPAGWPRPKLREGANNNPRRLYRTDNLACVFRLRDQTQSYIELISRKDEQIELHGQRLEPGYIEHHIREEISHANSCYSFSNVIVDVIHRKCDSSSHQLAAFIVVNRKRRTSKYIEDYGTTNFSLRCIRKALCSRLPDHMRPSIYMTFAAGEILRKPSGQVHRAKLRQLGKSCAESVVTSQMDIKNALTNQYGEYTISIWSGSPHTENQRLLVPMCSLLLNIPLGFIRGRWDFYAAGGDFIKAAQLIAGLRRAVLFEMAKTMRTCGSHEDIPEPFSLLMGSKSDIMKIVLAQCGVMEDKVEDIYPSTPEQDRLLRETILTPNLRIRVTDYSLPETIDLEKFRLAWDTVILNTPILKTRLVDIGNGKSVQVVIKDNTSWRALHDSEHVHPLNISHRRPAHECEGFTVGFGTNLAMYEIGNWINSPDTNVFRWTIHQALCDDHSRALIWKVVNEIYHVGKILTPTSPMKIFIKHCAPALKAPLRLSPYDVYEHERKKTGAYTSTMSTTRRSALVQAAFAIALSITTSVTDVVFRFTSDGRDTPLQAIERIVGPTIALVPVRVIIRPQEPVKALLDFIEQTSVERSSRQHRGFETVRKLNGSIGAACSIASSHLVFDKTLWNGKHEDNRVKQFHGIYEDNRCLCSGTYYAPGYIEPLSLPLYCNIVTRGFEYAILQDHPLDPKYSQFGLYLERTLRELTQSVEDGGDGGKLSDLILRCHSPEELERRAYLIPTIRF